MTHDDEQFLRRAIELAAAGRVGGDAPFGSLLVGPDGAPATAAATTLYTSCQPCGMCSGAIDRSGLGRVVYALSNDQLAELKPSGGFPHVGQEGPALFGEASAAVAVYYR